MIIFKPSYFQIVILWEDCVFTGSAKLIYQHMKPLGAVFLLKAVTYGCGVPVEAV